ncbi:restriction endonuclease [Bombella intestini]|uniref:Restriction endonuclease n=1 Tax=Bombella intestini TaxID=1539051 RepID=A0A1S8GR44_9PROT|nr:restriction endonuclease [Bombella intestini]OOL19526.1 restriction endonuclease [Bombella intestini]
MAIPDYQTLMLPVLQLAAIGEQCVPDAAERVADDLCLSSAEREKLLPSGQQRVLNNRIHWAKFYLIKAGLVASPRRGRFVATDKGRKLLASAPVRIGVNDLMTSQEFRDFYSGPKAVSEAPVSEENVMSVPDGIGTPEEQIEAVYQDEQAALRAELLERIMQNSPAFFERLIVDLLIAMGYGGSHRNAATQLGRSGDGGVDGVIDEDRLGLDRVYVQAKRYTETTIGRPAVQGFIGSLVERGASKGVFVTTSTFSSPARECAQRVTQRVILIDGKELAELMIEHGVGVRVWRRIEFKRLDEDFFTDA